MQRSPMTAMATKQAKTSPKIIKTDVSGNETSFRHFSYLFVLCFGRTLSLYDVNKTIYFWKLRNRERVIQNTNILGHKGKLFKRFLQNNRAKTYHKYKMQWRPNSASWLRQDDCFFSISAGSLIWFGCLVKLTSRGFAKKNFRLLFNSLWKGPSFDLASRPRAAAAVRIHVS